jgi:hypothetical protein
LQNSARTPRTVSTSFALELWIKAHFQAGSSSNVTVAPTLVEWALAGLIAFLALFGVYSLRQQRI